MPALQVGGWSIPGAVILDAITDRIENNDASAVYNRLSSPAFQKWIHDDRPTIDEIAVRCFQSTKTFHQSLRRLESLGLITSELVTVKGRTRPALDIQIVPINPILPEPAPIPLPFMVTVETTPPPPAPRTRTQYPPRPEWGSNAPREVLTLLDKLQGGKPASVTDDHYDRELIAAKKIAHFYTPTQVAERWREIGYKPNRWLSARWMYDQMPKTEGIKHNDVAQSDFTRRTKPTPVAGNGQAPSSSFQRRPKSAPVDG